MATTQPNRHPVFVDSNGQAIKLFLETNVRNRTKLIRTILKQGDKVVHDPSEADILIADSTSREVRDIIDAWGKDKVLLDTRWIYRCLEAGKVIGKDQSWGGYGLESVVASRGFDDQDSDDDSEKGEDEDEKDEMQHEGVQDQVTSSILSRPRKQIVKTVSPRKGTAKNVSEFQTQLRKDLSPPNIKISDSPPPAKKRRLDEIPQYGSGSAEIAPYPSQGFITSHSPSFPSPPPNFPLSQYIHAPSPSTASLPQSTQDICAAVGHTVLSSPEYVRHLGPIINQILSQAHSNNPEAVATQLRDIAEVISASNSSSQSNSQMPPSNQALSFVDSATSRSDTTGPNPTSPRSEGEMESTVLTATHPHRAGSLLSSDGGTRRTTGAWRLPNKERENEQKTSAVQQQQHEGFLSSPDGTPTKFYIDMDLKNRRDLLKIVKKNGGAIVNLMDEGDYVILNDRSPHFLKRSYLVPQNKPATSHRWLEECARRNTLVPPQAYLLETGSPKRRRSKPASKGSKIASTSKATEPPSPAISRMVKPPSQQMRSPSPPVHIATMSSDNYGFTEQEKEWFLRYIRFRWSRDPTIAETALINAIADKAPHHSNNNWRLAYHRIWATEVKDIRQEMGLAT